MQISQWSILPWTENKPNTKLFNYMIRAKLFKDLKTDSMNMRTIFDNEKIKLETGSVCNYCGSTKELSLDHIFPQKYGGKDNAET